MGKTYQRLGHYNPKVALETYAHPVPDEDYELEDNFKEALGKNLVIIPYN